MTRPIRVLIADDHPVVRSGIRQLLERAEDIEVTGEASSGEETIHMVQEKSPDILLLDMEMQDMNGSFVAQRLQQSGASVKILVLSAHDDPLYIHELMEAGAVGYLVKDEAPENILDAIRGVANGEQGWVSRSIAARMVSWVRGDEEPEEGAIKFTPREMEVLKLLTEAKTNQQIAFTLGISEKTVEKYLFTVFQKIGVNSRTEAAVYAIREGIF